MPITDPSMPVRLLDALTDASIPFVILHREEDIGTAALEGDLDVAIASAPDEAIAAIWESLAHDSMIPVLKWPYDVGGTATFFVTDPSGAQGLQADFMYDLNGDGRYGARSSILLEGAVPGRRYPVLNPIDQQLYLLSKRWSKAQQEEVDHILRGLEATGLDAARQRCRAIFSDRRAPSIEQLLDGNTPSKEPFGKRPRDLRRKISRVRRPIGFWVEVVGPENEATDLARALVGRFNAWLPHVAVGPRPDGIRNRVWHLTQVVPIRSRPGLYVSTADRLSSPRSDLTIEVGAETTTVTAASSIVEAMADRLKRRSTA